MSLRYLFKSKPCAFIDVFVAASLQKNPAEQETETLASTASELAALCLAYEGKGSALHLSILNTLCMCDTYIINKAHFLKSLILEVAAFVSSWLF